jgi:hypothetical protein
LIWARCAAISCIAQLFVECRCPAHRSELVGLLVGAALAGRECRCHRRDDAFEVVD